jgi:hypothetical protein
MKNPAAGLVADLLCSMGAFGAEQPGLRSREIPVAHARLGAWLVCPETRQKLLAFAGWLRLPDGGAASDREARAVLADFAARGNVANPYAYYRPGSPARERLRRATA